MTTKITTKKILTGIILVSSAIILPSSAFAANIGADVKVKTGVGVNFCTTLESRSTEFSNHIQNLTQNFVNEKSDRISAIDARRQTRDENLTNIRSNGDEKHDTRFTILSAKATTDAQKAAVAQFQADVTAAITLRRSSIDTAIKNYRDGVNNLVSTKFIALDDSVATLNTDVDQVLTQAKNACDSGTASTTVLATLKASLKSDQANFKNARSTDKIKADIETLDSTRKAAVTQAVVKFKADLAQATAKLKAAFKADANTNSGSIDANVNTSTSVSQ